MIVHKLNNLDPFQYGMPIFKAQKLTTDNNVYIKLDSTKRSELYEVMLD